MAEVLLRDLCVTLLNTPECEMEAQGGHVCPRTCPSLPPYPGQMGVPVSLFRGASSACDADSLCKIFPGELAMFTRYLFLREGERIGYTHIG